MRTRGVYIFLLVLLAPVFLLAQKQKIKGNKDVVSISHDIPGSIEAIEISGAINVEIQQARSNSYVLTADENLVDVIEVKNQNSTLKIFSRQKIAKSKELSVFLKVQDFSKLSLNDDASATNAGKLEFQNLEILLNDKSDLKMDLVAIENINLQLRDKSSAKLGIESSSMSITSQDNSNLKAELNLKNLNVFMDKASDAKIEGKADDASFDLEDRSNLNARKLHANNVKLVSRNKADIHILADKSLVIDAEGKSKIYVYGNPDINIEGLTDKSRIVRK